MAKVQSFADKAAKLAKKHENMVMCPDTKKETRIINVRLIESVKSDKRTIREKKVILQLNPTNKI